MTTSAMPLVVYSGCGEVQAEGTAAGDDVRSAGRGRVVVHVGDSSWLRLRLAQEVPLSCSAVEWVAVHPAEATLYACCCFWDFRPAKASSLTPGALAQLTIDPQTGLLRQRWRPVPSGGHQPCHLAVSPSAELLAVAHYLCGSVSIFRVSPLTGAITEPAPVHLLPLAGHVDPDRVLGTHRGALAHGVCFDSEGSHLICCNAGQGSLVTWRLPPGSSEARTLESAHPQVRHSRPRHCVLSADARALYVLHELANEVTIHGFDKETGRVGPALARGGVHPGAGAGGRRASPGLPLQAAAELVLLASGDLAVSNRAIVLAGQAGEHSGIAVLDGETLRLKAWHAVGRPQPMGDPRHAAALPAQLGGGLLCCLQGSGGLARVDLTSAAAASAVADGLEAPVCVAVKALPPEPTARM